MLYSALHNDNCKGLVLLTFKRMQTVTEIAYSDECPLLDLDDHVLHKITTMSGCSVLRSCKRIYDVTTATERVFMALSDNNIDIDEALIKASGLGADDAVEILLKTGANVHARDDSALRQASENGHISVVEILIRAGSNVHARDDLALILASRDGHISVVEILQSVEY